MPKLNIFNNVSLDGYFTDSNNDMSWAHAGADDPELREFTVGNAKGAAALVFGRVTYEMMAGFWPTPMAAQMMPEVAVGMNRDFLPADHGYPARLIVPGLYGYVSATKWLTDIRLTTLDDFDGYWIGQGWAKLGPVKTQSRIDVPRDGAELSPGTVAVAGVAFAQHKGIAKVEVKIDDGAWHEATLATNVSNDAWRQWYYPWNAQKGSHDISVRATDLTGYTQTAKLADPAPNGATGWHTIGVEVG